MEAAQDLNLAPDLLRRTFPFAKEDRAKSWGALLVTLGWMSGLLAGAMIDWWLPGQILCSTGAGLVIVRMFIIYHDFHHGAVFRNSKPATWILNLFGLLVLNPPNIWKRSHNYHHRNNSQMFSASIGSFPVMTKTDYAKAPWFKKLEYQVARHWITIAVAYVTIFVLGMCLNSFRKDPLKHWDSLVAVLLNAALFGLLLNLGGWQLVLLGLVWPLTLSCALGAYLFYIQHNFPDVKIRPRETWDFFFAALHSSSYMEGGKFTHWFTGNIGYHHVHHLNSSIPFYNLPKAMAAIPELQKPGRTSLRPRDILTCLRLKVWDVDAQRMVSL
jgi:omega-6 fatty acid desaturase (delta-12 desaturase)